MVVNVLTKLSSSRNSLTTAASTEVVTEYYAPIVIKAFNRMIFLSLMGYVMTKYISSAVFALNVMIHPVRYAIDAPLCMNFVILCIVQVNLL